MQFEKGDKFIINWDSIKKNDPDIDICLYPNRGFTVNDIGSRSKTIYYMNDCDCGLCNQTVAGIKLSKYGIKNQIDGYQSVIRSNQITLTQKKIQSERNNKLKDLGI